MLKSQGLGEVEVLKGVTSLGQVCLNHQGSNGLSFIVNECIALGIL